MSTLGRQNIIMLLTMDFDIRDEPSMRQATIFEDRTTKNEKASHQPQSKIVTIRDTTDMTKTEPEGRPEAKRMTDIAEDRPQRFLMRPRAKCSKLT